MVRGIKKWTRGDRVEASRERSKIPAYGGTVELDGK